MILSVYNICGILWDNTEKYIPYLDSLVKQNVDHKIVVSACMPKPNTIPTLQARFPNIDFVVVEENLPVNITFNYSVLKMIEKYGKFDSYLYMSCDSYFTDTSQLKALSELMTEDVGLVCPRLLKDSGYAFGLRLGAHRFDDFGASLQMFQYGDYEIPIGKAVNAHTLLYSSKIQEYYGRCCPDIFKGFCTESVLSFVAGAIGLKWVISKDIVMGHDVGLDTPSAGQGVQKHSETRPSHDHPFIGETLLPIFECEYARKIGLGYEECQGVVMHDESQWNGHICKNQELAPYIKENVYLADKFDYTKVKGHLC